MAKLQVCNLSKPYSAGKFLELVRTSAESGEIILVCPSNYRASYFFSEKLVSIPSSHGWKLELLFFDAGQQLATIA
jgi:hypothetical protein